MEFDDYRDADDACYEMNGRDLLGDRVTVEIARGTPHGRDREKWGSGSGGNGGGRDRRDGGNILLFVISVVHVILLVLIGHIIILLQSVLDWSIRSCSHF